VHSLKRKLVVVTVEGLGSNLVGCYGSAIAPTKNLDHFASKSIVFDQFWADTIAPADVLESLWSGSHYAHRRLNSKTKFEQLDPSIFEHGLLVTDSMEFIESHDVDRFQEVVLVESEPRDIELERDKAFEEDGEFADDGEQVDASTHFERLFEAALGKWASQMDDSPLLWIHSQGLMGPWDAPYEHRQVMCDEGDPDPPRLIEPPVLKIEAETDPDEIFGLACAAGGQAIALDEAWAILNEVLERLGVADDCLLCLIGVRGYPMSEHGWFGFGPNAIYSETVHLPLIMRPGNHLNLGIRAPYLIQPNHLLSTFVEWLQGAAIDQTLQIQQHVQPSTDWQIEHQLAYACWNDQVHISVPGWTCRWTVGANESMRCELFAMPDDRHQQNEVSLRAVSIVEQLETIREAWESSALASARLPIELVAPLR
jgi:hypothetical protein